VYLAGVSNPSLLKFALNLEAIVLQRTDAAAADGKPLGWDPSMDDTVPAMPDELKGPATEFARLLGLGMGGGGGAGAKRGGGAAAGGGAKRKAPAAKKAKGGAGEEGEAEGAADEGIEWQSEYRNHTIAEHSMDVLKAYLRANRLPLSGKKADLVDRVTAHLKKTVGDAPAPAAAGGGGAIAVDDDDDDVVEVVEAPPKSKRARK
jgi:hypothetical protein